LKQIDFEPRKLETKHLVFFPKTEDLFSPPQSPKIVPYTPNSKPSKCPHSHENLRKYPKHLLSILMDAFVIEHTLPKLPLDPFMMWRLHQVNYVRHKVMGEPLEWHALNIMKYHNVFYYHTIATQGLLRCSFKQCLQFEVHGLKLCFLHDANI
jgi:hypothetical protein